MITKTVHIHDDIIANAKKELAQAFHGLSPTDYGMNKHGKNYYRKLQGESLKNAERSHLVPPPRAYKINWNTANCASRCTTSILFDDMTWKEYCQKIQTEHKQSLRDYRKTHTLNNQ